MASAGSGNATHLAGELFKVMAGVDMTHVPYRGAAPAVTDLLGGQVQVYFGSFSVTVEHIRAGKLRALAVTTSSRFQLLPDVPAIGEFIPGYEASQWFAMGLRKSTAPEVVGTLNDEIATVLRHDNIKARLAELGTTAFLGSPAELTAFLTNEARNGARSSDHLVRSRSDLRCCWAEPLVHV
jgi:tripartite-type tricarboxylate transporter receptor subunit TctC